MIRYLYDLFLILPISTVIFMFINQIGFQTKTSIPQYIVLGLWTIYIVAIKVVKKRWKVILLAVPAFSCSIGFLLWKILKMEHQTGLHQIFLLPGACVLVGILLFWGMEKKMQFRMGITVALCIACVLYLRFPGSYQKLDVIAMLFMMVIHLAIWIQMKWVKCGNTDLQKHVVGVLPFLLVMTLAVSFVPTSEKPYDWQFFKTVWVEMKNKAVRFEQNVLQGGKEGYETAYMGFGERGKLGSSIQKSKNDKEVLTFMPYAGYTPYAYLQGMTFDAFDGREWTQAVLDDEREMDIDAAEAVYACLRYTDTPEDFLKISRSRIELKKMKTAHIFCSAKSYELRSETMYFDYTFSNGCPIFDKKRGLGMDYVASSLTFNQGNEDFINFVKASASSDQESYKKNMSNVTSYGNYKDISYLDFQKHRERIYETYLPDTLVSEQVADYLNEVVGDAETSYEKAQRIKSALMEMEYTYEIEGYPQNITDSKEYLDYFLFQSRKGYCMHFATAMVLLARAEGIPARYVQGYYVKCDGRNTVSVYSSDAHAWAQVYIDGLGWLNLDATPTYGDGPVITWDQKKKEDSYHSTYDWTGSSSDSLETTESEEQMIEEQPKNHKFLVLFAVTFGFAILAFFVCNGIAKYVSLKKMKTQTLREQSLTLCKENLRLLAMVGFTLNQGETLEELKKRVSDEVSDGALDFIPIMEHLIYSDCEPGEQIKQEIEISKNALFESLLKRRGRIHYGIGRIVFR